jgi:hypothetical protein
METMKTLKKKTMKMNAIEKLAAARSIANHMAYTSAMNGFIVRESADVSMIEFRGHEILYAPAWVNAETPERIAEALVHEFKHLVRY